MAKVAVVTGASYGIGESITKVLLKEKYKIYGISRTQPKIQHPQLSWIQADLTDSKSFSHIPKEIIDKRIDLLINNVGTALPENVLEFDEEKFATIFNLNFKAPIKLTLALMAKLAGGIIINISSLSDRFPDGLYGSSKAALNLYFESIAEVRKDIRILNVLPSYVDTPLLRDLHKSDLSFMWKSVNHPDNTAKFIEYVVNNPEVIDSGSRVVVISNKQNDGNFDPEKLWLFLTDNNKLRRLK